MGPSQRHLHPSPAKWGIGTAAGGVERLVRGPSQRRLHPHPRGEVVGDGSLPVLAAPESPVWGIGTAQGGVARLASETRDPRIAGGRAGGTTCCWPPCAWPGFRPGSRTSYWGKRFGCPSDDSAHPLPLGPGREVIP